MFSVICKTGTLSLITQTGAEMQVPSLGLLAVLYVGVDVPYVPKGLKSNNTFAETLEKGLKSNITFAETLQKKAYNLITHLQRLYKKGLKSNNTFAETLQKG